MGVTKKGEDYFIDYYVGGHRRRQKVGPSRQVAEAALRKIKVAIAENRFLDVRREPEITLREMFDQYLDLHSKPNKRSWKDDEIISRRLVAYFGASTLLSRITREKIELYRAQRKTEVSPARVNREVVALKAMFNKAIEWEKAAKNPVKGIKLYRESPGRVRYLEKGEWDAMMRVTPEWMKPVLQVAIHTGMRQNEILSLRWDDVDLARRMIYVRYTKSGEGRHIPINDALAEVLARIEPRPDSPLVLHDRRGRPIKAKGALRSAFERALKKAGVVGVTFHTIRHSTASHLVMAGVDIRTVGEILGHRSGLRMTLRYSHLSPAHKLDAINRLSRTFAVAETGTGHFLDTGYQSAPTAATAA